MSTAILILWLKAFIAKHLITLVFILIVSLSCRKVTTVHITGQREVQSFGRKRLVYRIVASKSNTQENMNSFMVVWGCL